MTDKQHTSGRQIEDANIIDMEMKEVHLSNEELAANYVDTKQAAQLLDNAAERTFYRLLEKCKEDFKFIPASVSVKSKNYYLKSDILQMGDLLKKQPVVIAYRTERLTDKHGKSDNKTDNMADNLQNSDRGLAGDRQSTGTDLGRMEQDEDAKNTKLAVIEGLKSISEFRSDIRELNDNVRSVNTNMQNIMTRVVEQGIDLKERYLKDREERTNIERQQADNLAKQAEAFTKQSQALIELTQKFDQKKPETNSNLMVIICIGIVVLFAAGWGAFYFFTTNQQKMEYQFEDRLAQERQNQQDQFQQTLKQLKESLTPVTNATVNAVVPPAGQGK